MVQFEDDEKTTCLTTVYSKIDDAFTYVMRDKFGCRHLTTQVYKYLLLNVLAQVRAVSPLFVFLVGLRVALLQQVSPCTHSPLPHSSLPPPLPRCKPFGANSSIFQIFNAFSLTCVIATTVTATIH